MKVMLDLKPQSLEQKISAAVFITVHGAEYTGIATKAALMWPCTEFSDDQVRKESSSILGEVHAALLSALPMGAIDSIMSNQRQRLAYLD